MCPTSPLLSSYSPFLWVCGSLLAAFCLWSRWMPPTSWSGLEDAEGPEEEEGEGERPSGGGKERERERERERYRNIIKNVQRLVLSSHGRWTWCLHAANKLGLKFGPHGNTEMKHTASGWPWWYLIFSHTHTHTHTHLYAWAFKKIQDQQMISVFSSSFRAYSGKSSDLNRSNRAVCPPLVDANWFDSRCHLHLVLKCNDLNLIFFGMIIKTFESSCEFTQNGLQSNCHQISQSVGGLVPRLLKYFWSVRPPRFKQSNQCSLWDFKVGIKCCFLTHYTGIYYQMFAKNMSKSWKICTTALWS